MIRWVGKEKFDVIDMKRSNFYKFKFVKNQVPKKLQKYNWRKICIP